MAGEGRLLSSDPDGNVYLWQSSCNKDTPEKLEPADCDISSLAKIDNRITAGLSETGRLFFWDINRKRIIDYIDCPAPLSPSSGLCYWPPQRCLLYPAADGAVAVFNPENHILSSIDAHPGQYFSLAHGGSCFYTMGFEDGLMKIYSGIDGHECRRVSGPPGIVCVSVLDGSSGQFILIDDQGRAGVYGIAGKKLELTDCLDGYCYNTVIMADPEYKRIADAAWVKDRIQECILSNQVDGLVHRINELKELGFPLTALCLNVSAAREKGDIVDYLAALKEMIDSLPPEKSHFEQYLVEYAGLLCKTWNLPEAVDVFTGIDGDCVKDFEYLKNAAQIMLNNNYVIESDIEIDRAIASASVIGKKFKGMWVIDKKSSLPLRNITASMIADKYNQIRENNMLTQLPEAETIHPFWITRDTAGETEIVIFSRSAETSSVGLIYGIRIERTGFDSFFTPIVIFSAGKPENEIDTSGHNSIVLNRYKNTTADKSCCRWPDILFKTVRDAIQQVNTYALNKYIQGK